MEKIDIKKLSLKEKVLLLTGADIWRTYGANGKLKQLFLADGPQGLRMIDTETNKPFNATALPACHVLANTWNKDMAYEYSSAIADECILHNADVLLGPGVNIKRNPLCGRNFEYFSEDPFLSGELGKAYVKGVQDKGIGACVKHYCANNNEYDRCYQSSEVDNRTLHEIYLRPFEMCMEEKPWSIMCSYNPINGIYASENRKLLNDVLRKEFGFDGLIMSDWGAVHNPLYAVKATLDLCMPHHKDYQDILLKAVEDGKLTEKEIDERVQKVLDLIEKSESNYSKRKISYTDEQRHEKAVEVAKEGVVLLKNDGDILPFVNVSDGAKKYSKIFFYGANVKKPFTSGGGSGKVETAFAQKPLNELVKNISGIDTAFMEESRFEPCWRAVFKQAYDSDVSVIAMGDDTNVEGEGFNRYTMRLSNEQEDIILNIASHSEKTIVILYTGSAVDMSAWIDYVDAVVFAGYAGEGANEALSNLLCGKSNFSGKLAETFPITLQDAFKGGRTFDGETDLYDDGIFVGYRYYDYENKEVLFPFGHGLSYAQFEYSNIRIVKNSECDYEVLYDITNISNVAGKEISQVYVKDVSSMVRRPKKELKGFSKDYLEPNETKTISVKLDFSSFAYYNVSLDKWYIENGTFEVLVGGSSRNLPLKAKLNVQLPQGCQYSDG